MSSKDKFVCRKAWEAEMLDEFPWFGDEPYAHSFTDEQGGICNECKKVIEQLKKEKIK